MPKQVHCTATCAIPSNAATQANPLISLQHAISSWLFGNVRMLKMANVELVMPRRTK